MLKSLVVKNFAIIEDLTVVFKEGLTVLSGETGAGKSLIIDSISLILGSRADSSYIRYGSEEANILASFSYSNEIIDNILEANSINILDELIIERTISKTKSVIKINKKIVNLNILKSVTLNLADLHSQTDSFKLLNKESYLSFIDDYKDKDFIDLLNEYTINKSSYLNCYKELEEIKRRNTKSKENLDYLNLAYNEISKLELKVDLDKELESEINRLNNYDKIYNNLLESYNNLNNEYFNLDNIYNSFKLINNIKQYDNKLSDISSNLLESYNLSSQTVEDIKEYLNNLDFDPEYLNNLNLKLKEIENLELKYHKSCNELIEYSNTLKLEIDLSTNFESVIENKEKELKDKFDLLIESSSKISNIRKKKALLLSNNIVKECMELELFNTKFEIKFDNIDLSDYHNSSIFKSDGIDSIDFLVSLNLGEPLKPLSMVASGGEMARIMLSFKSVLAKNSKLSLMVFDEIDTGVSGKVAHEIGKKMKNISKYCQVIVISHLPQVAAIADNQLFIYKIIKDDRTITNVKVLNIEDRIREIAKMISGDKISEYALEQAKRMIIND